jgi:hypothetical protein
MAVRWGVSFAGCIASQQVLNQVTSHGATPSRAPPAHSPQCALLLATSHQMHLGGAKPLLFVYVCVAGVLGRGRAPQAPVQKRAFVSPIHVHTLAIYKGVRNIL